MKIHHHSLMRRIAGPILKTFAIIFCLYIFICDLTLLSTSFRILGGRNLSKLFSDSEILSNPIVGIMIGILVTVGVQSSATSTSIIVALVSAGVQVKHAIPMIFGSNIGTSVTNTIVSMTQAGDKEAFRRAFAAATVHDMFNWLSVIVLTVVELSTGFLEFSSGELVELIDLDSENATIAHSKSSGGPDLLKPLTKPLTNLIVQVDKKILLGWSFNDPEYANVTSILKTDCGKEGGNVTDCDYLLAYLGESGLGMGDVALGIILLIFSLTVLCFCLIGLMKILNSMLGTQMAIIIQKFINAKIPYVPWLTGYFTMFLGCVITILVRSSSVFTSTLTPLCGTGLVTLETAYPMTLGSNIGTTTTALLASFAAEGNYLKPSIQIALVHLLFNVFGILIFYPVPFMRWPIGLAKRLGDITAEFRWFAAVYLAAMFAVAPIIVFLLSLAGPTVLYSVMGPFMILVLIISVINVIQNHRSHWLPHCFRDWGFLPLWMRSLQPLDDLFSGLACCSKCMDPNSLRSPKAIRDQDDIETGKKTAANGHVANGNVSAEEMVVLVIKKEEDSANVDGIKISFSDNHIAA